MGSSRKRLRTGSVSSGLSETTSTEQPSWIARRTRLCSEPAAALLSADPYQLTSGSSMKLSGQGRERKTRSSAISVVPGIASINASRPRSSGRLATHSAGSSRWMLSMPVTSRWPDRSTRSRRAAARRIGTIKAGVGAKRTMSPAVTPTFITTNQRKAAWQAMAAAPSESRVQVPRLSRQRRAICTQGARFLRSRRLFSNRERTSPRRIFPLEVFGIVCGGTSATWSGGSPTLSLTWLMIRERIWALAAGSLDRVSATTTRDSVPLFGSITPNAATHPLRTPETSAAAASTSCGMMLWPALMMQSFLRPVICSSPPAR